MPQKEKLTILIEEGESGHWVLLRGQPPEATPMASPRFVASITGWILEVSDVPVLCNFHVCHFWEVLTTCHPVHFKIAGASLKCSWPCRPGNFSGFLPISKVKGIFDPLRSWNPRQLGVSSFLRLLDDLSFALQLFSFPRVSRFGQPLLRTVALCSAWGIFGWRTKNRNGAVIDLTAKQTASTGSGLCDGHFRVFVRALTGKRTRKKCFLCKHHVQHFAATRTLSN